MSNTRHFWAVSLILSFLVHGVFCFQVISVASQGGMVRNTFFMLAFYPHVLLMFFLPPASPIGYSGGIVTVDWLRFTGKLATAYPASLVYGLVLEATRCFIRNRRRV